MADFPNIPIDITAEELLKTVEAGTHYFKSLSENPNWRSVQEGIYYSPSFTFEGEKILTKAKPSIYEEYSEFFYILVSSAKPSPVDFPYSRTIDVIGACEEDNKNIHSYKFTRLSIVEITLEEIESGANVDIQIDQTYNPESENAQSGKAVAAALQPVSVWNFLEIYEYSKNIFDPSQEMVVGQVLTDTGTLSANRNYDSTSNFIDVSHIAGRTIYPLSSIRTIVQYNAAKEIISTKNYIGVNGATLEENVAYIKITIPTGEEESYVLTADSVPTKYIPYGHTYKFTDNISTEDLLKDVSEKIGVGLNVFDNTVELETGILNADGTKNPGSYSAYKTTVDYMAVKPSQIYTISYLPEGASGTHLSGFRAYCFYDKNKEYISGWSEGVGLPSQIVTPENCYYIRFSFSVSNLPNMYISEGNYKPSLGAEYAYEQRILPSIQETKLSALQGKTILGIGDSITQADGCEAGWLMRTANALGMRGRNKGIKGSTIAINENKPTERYPMVERYAEMEDADIVVVLGGSNDWFYAWTPIGTFDDRTNYTFYGALHNLINGLLAKYENSLVVFATPIKRGNVANMKNGNNKTLEEYCDIIKEVCSYYGVPVIDTNKQLQLAPFIEWQNEKYFLEVSDGQGGMVHDYTHPNDDGHAKLASYITGQIKGML